MLTRKPRIGEVLTFQPPGRTAIDVKVIRFLETQPSIMAVWMPGGFKDTFIWQHGDGLNTYLSHKIDPKGEDDGFQDDGQDQG